MMYNLFCKNSESVAKWRQYLAAVLIGPISFGICMSWTSPVLPQLQNNNNTLPFTLTVSEGSWVGSMLAVGVLFFTIPAGYFGDRFGAKKATILLVIPTVVFTIMVILANDVYTLCIARFIVGLSAAGFDTFAPLYLIEISDTSRRAIVSSFSRLLMYGGVLLTSVFGAYFQYKSLTVIYCVFTVIISVALSFFPESPVHLLRTNQRQKAEDALKFFRSETFNSESAIAQMEKSLQCEENVDFKNCFKSKCLRRGLIATFGLALFERLSGFDTITFYNVQICKAADTGMDVNTLSIILSAVQCFSHVIVIIVAEKAPRRLLMIFSSVICGASLFVLAAYFHLKHYGYHFYGMNLVPLLSISIFLFGYCSGIGPISWILLGELFPANFKYVAAGLTGVVLWGTMFFISKIFPLVLDSNPHYPFYFYGFCMILCIFFVKVFVPETKGKSLQQIQIELGS